jgi:Uncharacterized protein conserved in bacteria (DUF2334)
VPAEYLFRLDDACSTMDARRWEAVLKVLFPRGVRPIIAIIPANGDPALAGRTADPDFWQRARSWAGAGCMIALHGYSHVLRPSRGGLVPVQRRSEFVGLPLDVQRRRIFEGVRVMEANGLAPEAWVAPAHGFDSLTVQALRLESDIRVISDGFMRRAVRREDFIWLPQQLWRPRVMKRGLWTICLHPNDIDDRGLEVLDGFISSRRALFSDPHEAVRQAAQYGPGDALFAAAFGAALRARQLIMRAGRNMK